MDTTALRSLFAYNSWANTQIFAAAARLTAEQFVAPAHLSHGSIRGTLVHLVSTEWMWRVRCQEGQSPSAMLGQDAFATLHHVQQRATAEAQAMRAFLATIDEAALRRSVHYMTTRGVACATPLWHILLHVVNHGTQFRSEAAVTLSVWGCSPGDLDYMAFIRNHVAP